MNRVADADAGSAGEGLAVLRHHPGHRHPYPDTPPPVPPPPPGPRGHRKVPTGGTASAHR